ncbi:MAG: hypothetical protein WHT65_11040 [Pseudothermotoga sp.]
MFSKLLLRTLILTFLLCAVNVFAIPWDVSYAVTSDVGYIVAGYTWSNDSDVSGNHGEADIWAVKLDRGRNIVKVRMLWKQ